MPPEKLQIFAPVLFAIVPPDPAPPVPVTNTVPEPLVFCITIPAAVLIANLIAQVIVHRFDPLRGARS